MRRSRPRVLCAALRLTLTVGLILIGSGCDAGDQNTASLESKEADSRRAPNLIIITLDTTRADALGIYGQERATSPKIDKMGREGTIFTSALASSPLTLPSHSSLFSGQFPFGHGVRSNAGYVLSDSTIMLAEIMRGRGYRTAAEVAANVLRKQTGIDQGFEQYRGPGDPDVKLKTVKVGASGKRLTRKIRTGADIANAGIDFIRENRERSFFLWLHFFDAHQPYVIPPPDQARFAGNYYYEAIAVEDQAVGRVLEEIEQLGLRDDTLVVLTADHGEGLHEHEEETHSYFVYDSTMHVPLVFWGLDKVPRGQRHSEIVRVIDIAPTALELLGLQKMRNIQGVSLAPLIAEPTRDLSLTAYGESFESVNFFGLSPIRFVREGQWKYIHKVNPELYDIDADPGELHNVADRQPEIVQRLRARLEELIREAPAKPSDSATAIDPQVQAELQALGYVTNDVTPEDFDELASLDVSGIDPATKINTMSEIARAIGQGRNELYDDAARSLEALIEEEPGSSFLYSELAKNYVKLEAHEKARKAFQTVIELDSCNERALTELNRLWKVEENYDALVETLRAGAETCPEFAGNLNNYAWALATLPRDDLRDGETAVEAAEFAVDLMGDRPPGFLDTLAVALAEAGHFEEAIEIQGEALLAAEDRDLPPEVVDQLRDHLVSFRAAQPIRSPAAAPSN